MENINEQKCQFVSIVYIAQSFGYYLKAVYFTFMSSILDYFFLNQLLFSKP